MGVGRRMDYEEFRRQKDDFFRAHPHSPIPRPSRADFPGLEYYPPVPELRQRVRLRPGDGSEVIAATSDGQQRRYTRAAWAPVRVGNESVDLLLLGSQGEGFFLPFRDATSGPETYGAGRYLDIDDPGDGTVVIDFNLANHPYCAYDDVYSCPLPPTENWLTVPIRAGERLPVTTRRT